MQMPAASATARNCCPNKIVIHFTHKRTEAPQLFQHRQHIAGRAAGIGLKQRVSLAAGSVLRKVNQKLAQRDNVIHSRFLLECVLCAIERMCPNMSEFSFSVFPNENFLDLRLFQYGWEQCAPLHSFGPFVRNHFLFHYVISGKGYLDANGSDGVTRRYTLEPDQGFLICPGQVNTYCADERDPWKYAWLEFGGLRAGG